MFRRFILSSFVFSSASESEQQPYAAPGFGWVFFPPSGSRSQPSSMRLAEQELILIKGLKPPTQTNTTANADLYLPHFLGFTGEIKCKILSSPPESALESAFN